MENWAFLRLAASSWGEGWGDLRRDMVPPGQASWVCEERTSSGLAVLTRIAYHSRLTLSRGKVSTPLADRLKHGSIEARRKNKSKLRTERATIPRLRDPYEARQERHLFTLSQLFRQEERVKGVPAQALDAVAASGIGKAQTVRISAVIKETVSTSTRRLSGEQGPPRGCKCSG